jgi:uncharacterized protein YqfA (UPF0365 family)
VDIGIGTSQLKATGVSITINDLQGSFVNGTPIDQAVTVLHGLGHAFVDLWGIGASAIKPDGKTVPDHVQVSMDNTALIKEKCFK